MSAFKQVTARTISEDITFWEFVKSHLTKHETERFVYVRFLIKIAIEVL